jgi:hypothetical protein
MDDYDEITQIENESNDTEETEETGLLATVVVFAAGTVIGIGASKAYGKAKETWTNRKNRQSQDETEIAEIAETVEKDAKKK